MPYTQSFLPIRTQDSRILGIIPIGTTVFSGSETSIVIGAGTFPLAEILPVRVSADVVQNNSSTGYMALTVTPSEERGSYQSFSFMEQQIPFSRWVLAGGIIYNDVRDNPMQRMLRGNAVNAIMVPVPAAVSAVSGVVSVAWATTFGTAEQFSFFEQNWVSLMQATSGNANAVTLNIGAPAVPTVLATPTVAAGVGSTTGGTLAANTYYVRIVAVDAFGAKTTGSPVSTIVTTTGATSSVAYTWAAVPNAVSYEVWYGTAPGVQGNFYATAATSFTLVASAGTAGTIPPANTTGTLGVTSAGRVGLYVVTSNPQIVNASISMNTVRFVKLTRNTIPAGSYVWNCTVTNTDGSTTPVRLTLVVR